MRKILLIALVVVVLLLVSVPLWIDSAAKSAIESGGAAAMGVETTLESIDIGIFGGEASLAGLKIANPDGFDATPHFLSLEGGTVAVTLGTVMDDEVVIPRLVLTGLDINLERNTKGANYKKIMKNMESGEETESTKKFVIKELVIKNITAVSKLNLGVVKPGLPVVIEEMRFENVGSDGSGVSMSKLIRYIVVGVLQGVAKGGGLPKEIGSGLTEGLGGLKDLGLDSIKGLGETGKDLVEGVGGIFKKKKKDK